MTKEFALDLKVARRNSGLTQEDCAHLLDVCDATVAKIESGKRMPTIHEICTLSLIYGRSFESLFSGIFKEVRLNLNNRLASMPEGSGTICLRINRLSTLNNLGRRLSEEQPGYESC
jgi:transcriptional regulator with XRE-family HTH domain